jgi:hypothetical protein
MSENFQNFCVTFLYIIISPKFIFVADMTSQHGVKSSSFSFGLTLVLSD